MIGWIKGEKVQIWEQTNRTGLVINCYGIGYEVQLLQRDLKDTDSLTDITLWIHQLTREEGNFLYGFIEKGDRDLFRVLISVSGIGPQLAISLLEGNSASKLITAILNKDIATLTESPGVGKRTGERLIIELQNKLSHIPQIIKPNSNLFEKDLINEIKTALRNLEYKDQEINIALNTLVETYSSKVSQSSRVESLADFEILFKEVLMLLSQKNV